MRRERLEKPGVATIQDINLRIAELWIAMQINRTIKITKAERPVYSVRQEEPKNRGNDLHARGAMSRVLAMEDDHASALSLFL